MANNPGHPSQPEDPRHNSVGAWAKKYYFASRATMEAALRPHGLGSTQWYVLYQLANVGPTFQKDLGLLLRVERATLSGIVATLVGKGLVDQVADAKDQRQRRLHLTPAGAELWKALPDPIALIMSIAFEGADEAALDVAVKVLQDATRRLNDHLKGTEP